MTTYMEGWGTSLAKVAGHFPRRDSALQKLQVISPRDAMSCKSCKAFPPDFQRAAKVVGLLYAAEQSLAKVISPFDAVRQLLAKLTKHIDLRFKSPEKKKGFFLSITTKNSLILGDVS